MKIKYQGDDFDQNRLFSYLNEQFSYDIQQFTMLRKNVFFIRLSTLPLILKGFSSYHRLKLQETFTSSLKKEGFTDTYHFYELGKDPPLFFQQSYFGCLEYIEPSATEFSYHDPVDRLEGLNLLEKYHETSANLVDRYQTILGTFHLREKWNERTSTFINNLSLIKLFIQEEVLLEILSWADWSLKGMDKEGAFFNKGKPVILHGDVAHHNFIRTKSGDLNLIDFDLINVGYAHSDYLQYANRILPVLNWSVEELSELEKLKDFLNEKGFLYALGYPTDIFREWNRLIKEKNYSNPVKVRQVLDITIGQFYDRLRFLNDLKKLVSSGH